MCVYTANASLDSTSFVTPGDLKVAASELPPSPQVFGKLGKLLRDPNTGLNDITELVNTDASLTTRVLKLSNSAAFAQGMAIDNLDDAINRIGFREVFKLVGVAAASDLFTVQNQTYQISGTRLWENALACGLAMDQLAGKVGYDEQDMYTLGLLRSIGKMAIELCLSKKANAPHYPLAEQLPILEWEASTLGITNPKVASFLLASWNFSESTIQSIQLQYLDSDPESGSGESLLLNLACFIVEKIDKGLPGESGYWKPVPFYCERLGLQVNDLKQVLGSVRERLDEILQNIND